MSPPWTQPNERKSNRTTCTDPRLRRICASIVPERGDIASPQGPDEPQQFTRSEPASRSQGGGTGSNPVGAATQARSLDLATGAPVARYDPPSWGLTVRAHSSHRGRSSRDTARWSASPRRCETTTCTRSCCMDLRVSARHDSRRSASLLLTVAVMLQAERLRAPRRRPFPSVHSRTC